MEEKERKTKMRCYRYGGNTIPTTHACILPALRPAVWSVRLLARLFGFPPTCMPARILLRPLLVGQQQPLTGRRPQEGRHAPLVGCLCLLGWQSGGCRRLHNLCQHCCSLCNRRRRLCLPCCCLRRCRLRLCLHCSCLCRRPCHIYSLACCAAGAAVPAVHARCSL